MKKIFSLFLFLSLFAFPFLVFAQSYTSETSTNTSGDERIVSFTSNITVQQDSSYIVKETIVYDFGANGKHGIYRDIPYQYKRAEGNFNVRLTIQGVTDETGTPYKYNVSQEGENIRVKVGDPDVTVSGQHSYVITYTVLRGINYFNDHDELYWNVTGNGWGVPIEKVRSIVRLPNGIQRDDIRTECFTGIYGSTEKNCATAKSTSLVDSRTTSALSSSEGMTIVVGVPKGIITAPTIWQNILWFMEDNWVVFLPFIVFIVLFWRWMKYGRDPETGKHIAPMYDAPKGMTPAEVGVLVDEKADSKDISGMLIHLAVKGYIKIREIESKVLFWKNKDYEFIKRKEVDASLNEFEKTLLNGIFGGAETKKLSELKNKFYPTVKEIKKQLYQKVTRDGYFPTNPETVRGIYYGVGIFVIVAGFILGASIFESTAAIVSFVLSGILILIFSGLMPRKSAKGMENYIHIVGLKLYLGRAEKKQLDFFNAPEKKPEIFEKYLPFAMVLGVETAWAKEFEDMYKNPPDWYEARDMHTFNTLYLANSLNSFSTAATSTFTSTPSSAGSGGSGFSGGGSGGGFGGGGGGSW